MSILQRLANWIIRRKAAEPQNLGIDPDAGPAFADNFGVTRSPNAATLLKQFRETVYACATINANAVAAVTIRLFVKTGSRQRAARCPTQKLAPQAEKRIRAQFKIANADDVDEVTEHLLLDLMHEVNPEFTEDEMRTMTQLYQEIAGVAYWFLETNSLGVPSAIWLLPPQQVKPKRKKGQTPGGRQLIDAYEYKPGRVAQIIPAEQMIVFPMRSLHDPYFQFWSPTRAAYESITVSENADAFVQALLKNQARPDTMISPKEPMGPAETERAEKKFKRRFRRAGAGGLILMESSVDIKQLAFNLRELEMAKLSDMRRKRICNSFGVPWSMMDTENVNRANAEAGIFQHDSTATLPRIKKFVEKLNQDLTPLFDDRLFFWYDDFILENIEAKMAERTVNLGGGVITINEARAEDNRAPVDWGEEPWLPLNVAQVDVDRTPAPPTPPPQPESDDDTEDD